MHSKVLIPFNFDGVRSPLDTPPDPSAYTYSVLSRRMHPAGSGLGWLPRDLAASVFDSYEKLKANVISALVFHDALPRIGDVSAPSTMVDEKLGSREWWEAAQVVRTICNELGVFLVSYRTENNGSLFVHLVPQPGDDSSGQKSRGKLRGHTDAVAMPFPHEANIDAIQCPSPDMVILACLRNPNGVATRVAPLSDIMKRLSRVTIEKLQDACFDIFPQASFSTPEGYKLDHVPVLFLDQFDGYRIRFSHSKICPSEPRDNAARAALIELQDAVGECYTDLILQPGDLLLLNNRTAIHGRGLVADHEDKLEKDRWVMRTYGMHHDPSPYSTGASLPFVLG